MHFKSFTRSLAGLCFSLLFLLAACARPAFAQSDDDVSPDNTAISKLSVSPKTLSYDVNLDKAASKTDHFDITNDGTLPLDVTVGPPSNHYYAIMSPGALSPAGGSIVIPGKVKKSKNNVVEILVTFTPEGAGKNLDATIAITSSATKGKSFATVNLHGKATGTPAPAAPRVISTSPPITGCGGQGVPTNQEIVVTFNEAMDSSTITASTFLVTIPPSTTPIAGTVSYDATNNTAIFTPTSPLTVGTTYEVTITTGAKSAAEVPLASNFVFTFVTGASSNTTGPTLISTNPVAGATDVATNQKITAAFSEQMDSRTITGSTFTLTGPSSTPVAGTVTYSTIGAIATFTPTSALTAGTLFTATITTGASDLAGNALSVPFTWTFTTGSGSDTTAPTVTLTGPASSAPAVPTNSSINATFSKAMDVSTLNAATFLLVDETSSAPIAGKITYDPTNFIVTLTPVSALAAGDSFTATITNGAKDLEGNPLASGSVLNPWSFTTGSTASVSSIDLGAAASFEALATSTITNTGDTIVDGNIGLNAGSSVTGFPPGIVNGAIEIDTTGVAAAQLDLTAAFNDAAGLSPAAIVGGSDGNLAGLTLAPGIYTSTPTSFQITGGNLTLDAQGDSNAVWVFQMPSSTLTLTTPTCAVILANGAQAANVFWQVGSSATIGVGCAMEGNIMASASVTLANGASLDGRALAGESEGEVSMDDNAVSAAGACSQ